MAWGLWFRVQSAQFWRSSLHPGCSLPELFLQRNPIDIVYLFLFLRPVSGYAQRSLEAAAAAGNSLLERRLLERRLLERVSGRRCSLE